MEGTHQAVDSTKQQSEVRRLLESWRLHRVAYTPYRAWCEACVGGRGRNADHQRLAAEQDHAIDTVPVGQAFFGEHEQTAKLVLILRAHRCRWTEV